MPILLTYWDCSKSNRVNPYAIGNIAKYGKMRYMLLSIRYPSLKNTLSGLFYVS